MNLCCILLSTEDSGKCLISPEAVDVPPRYTDTKRYPVRIYTSLLFTNLLNVLTTTVSFYAVEKCNYFYLFSI